MGWVKVVVGVGVGLYSYRSLTRVNALVRQVTVPKYSLLAKHNSAQAGIGTLSVKKKPTGNKYFYHIKQIPGLSANMRR